MIQNSVNGDDSEPSWTPQEINTEERPSPALDPVFPSIQSNLSGEDLDDDLVPDSGLGSLPSFTDEDFPPLMGKQTSWADDVVTIGEDDAMYIPTTDVSPESAPLTPDFTASSITPLTPKTGCGFPRTPRSGNLEMMPNNCDGPYFDRLSLFVGGLPPYWEEDNVGEIFQRFGGLESVKVIRPRM
jgi:RNA recognition motif. (a.k.a. RRM, RBD, or RNP domain)